LMMLCWHFIIFLSFIYIYSPDLINQGKSQEARETGRKGRLKCREIASEINHS
jgi:hypothetical protein